MANPYYKDYGYSTINNDWDGAWQRYDYDKINYDKEQEERDRIARQKIKEQEKRKIKDDLITTLKTSIPAIVSLEKRRDELRQLLEFSLKMETYGDGLLDFMQEYEEIGPQLEKYYKLVESLARLKLGY